MPVLRERKTWKRESRKRHLLGRLTPEQESNVRAAVAFLRIQHGGLASLAKAMGVKRKSLEQLIGKGRHPSAGLAVRVAEIARVTVEDVLTGAFPARGACRMCGRGPE